jgi:hypothetical protein
MYAIERLALRGPGRLSILALPVDFGPGYVADYVM